MKRIKRFLNIYNNKYTIAVVVLLFASFIIGLSSVFFRYPMSWFDEQVHYARTMTYADNPLSITRGKVTKDEATKLIEMLNHRPKGPRPDNAPLN